MRRRAVLLLPLVAAACASDGPAQPDLPPPPLTFDHLMPLRLNVAEVRTEQRWQPPGRAPNVDHLAPVPPVTALLRMAQERVFAGGASGVATFVVQDASITATPIPSQSMFGSDGVRYEGRMMVRLEVRNDDPPQSGYATAQVSRTLSLPDRPGASEQRRQLDLMVRQMMADMNIEFEYQVRRSLKEWLQLPSDAPAPAPVQQEDLTAPSRS